MKQILISAGHNNVDPGAVNGKYKESVVAVDFRDAIYYALCSKLGKTVKVVRDGAKDGDNQNLNTAIKLAKASDIAIEIHLNAATSKAAHGCEALCHKDKAILAKNICAAINDATNGVISPRGDAGGWKSASSGQHARLGFCEAGGVILELGFISNNNDLGTLLSNKEQWAIIRGVTDVIVEHLAGLK